MALSIVAGLITGGEGALAALLALPGLLVIPVSFVYTAFKLSARQHDSLQASWARFFHAQG